MPQAGRVRITAEDERRNRITLAICGKTLEETRHVIGEKLGFEDPAACRLFNRHGAEIDDIDLLEDDDLVYAFQGKNGSSILHRHQGEAPVR
jgi:hypothetical protein